MVRTMIRRSLCILLIVITAMLCGCRPEPGLGYKLTTQSLAESRPATAGTKPDLSGNITDIRITAAERPAVIYNDSGKEHKDYQGYTFAQVYYGYCSDGVWYDLPLENYPLRSLYYDNVEGYALAETSHLVKIGPYVLICFCVNTGMYESSITLSDTLGTQPQIMFDEYDAPKYGFLKEKCAPSGNLADYSVSTAFPVRHFMIVEYEAITEDYVLFYQSSFSPHPGIETVQEIKIPAEAIWNALDPQR